MSKRVSPLLKVHLVAAILSAATLCAVVALTLASAAGLQDLGVDLRWWSMVLGVALFVLVVTTGTSGHFASEGRLPPRIRAKRTRMPWIGAPTLFGIAPLGVFAWWADHDAALAAWVAPALAVRALLAIGVLVLMALSARDGLALTVPRRRALRARRQSA